MLALTLLRVATLIAFFVGGYLIGRRVGWKEAEQATHRRAFAALRERCEAPGDARSAAFFVTSRVVGRLP